MISRIRQKTSGKRAFLGAGVLALLLTGACATRVTASNAILSPEAANLPRPTRVLVADFAVDPGADEGNRTRRMGIGFGAGKSIVEAQAELYAVVPDGPPVLLQTYGGKADSGRRPGLAVGVFMAVAQSNVAVGALSPVTNVGGEVRRTPVGKEAVSFGNRLATDIGEYAA